MRILDKGFKVHFRDQWHNNANTFTRGSAFVGECLLEEQDLSSYFSRLSTETAAEGANGFWGMVKQYESYIVIAADRMRSYPLFYGVSQNTVFVSDDAYWVKDAVGDEEFDEISKNEFLLTGYVTGCHTLCKNVKQIQAGEIIVIDFDEGGNVRFNFTSYYNFIHDNYFENLSKEQLMHEQEQILLKAVGRLINFARDRTIVIPLSGGYDSRLLATTLKRMNYRNVITFTYGRINNPEYLMSREVAERLEYKWIFIPYDNEKAYEWYNSSERKNFNLYSDNLSTILPDREWPAVWELKNQNLIPQDSVFAPGHSGDFISGGHIPEALFKEEASQEKLVSEILKKHYVMWNWQGVKQEWSSTFTDKILNCIEIKSHKGSCNAANLYEKWNWQENQIKRMVNSVKIYDFFGYDYWLPLWDYEYMDFWCRVPLIYRINKSLYDEYVVNIYAKTAHISIEKAEKRAPAIEKSNVLQKICKKSMTSISKLLSKEKCLLSKEEFREEDWEQASGRMTKNLYNTLLPYMVGRSSCATLERLGYISYTREDVPEATLKMLSNLRDIKAL